MKSMSFTRQFMILVIAFAVATPGAVCGLAYVFSVNGTAARKVAAEGNRQIDALFGLIGAVGQAQSAFQRLVREKDPDTMEKLIEQGKGVTKTALGKIREAGAEQGEVASSFDALGRANAKGTDLLLKGDVVQAQQALIEESNPAFERLLTAIGKAQEAVSQKEKAVVAETEASSSRAQRVVFVLVGVVLAGLITCAVFMLRRITATLCQAVSELSLASRGTASAASQISASSQVLAQASSEQAASLEETSASSEEISSMAQRNTENSHSAADLVASSQLKFVQANQSLEQTVAAMGEINTQSGKISKIIKVIDEIAFQTNILALNAAVEAARAGEAGMGFAVVADEVRSLAQRCAQAARDTAALIEESVAKSKDGKAKVDQVATAVHAITEESGVIKTLVDEVNLGSQEQARGIDQIGKAIIQMEKVTQTTAANAEEGAAAAEELTAQSETLKEIVERLNRMVGGGESVGASHTRVASA